MVQLTPKWYFTSDKDLLARLWIANPAYISALKRGAFVGYIKKEIPLYNVWAHDWVSGWYIPQWWLAYLWLESNEFKNEVVTFPPLRWQLRQHQVDIVDNLLRHRYAFWHISTGVGKTWILLEIARRLQRKTLIVVDGVSALGQFTQNIKDIFGFVPFLVGNTTKKNNENVNAPIHLTTIHSIEKTNPNSYGVILYDEADKYLAAINRRRILSSIATEYAYAVTGTIKLNEIDDKVFPVFYGRKEELILKHIKPIYTQIKTNFEFWQFENFCDIESALYSNKERNELIISTIIWRLKSGYNKPIIFCKRVEHAELLYQKFTELWYKTYMLIGKVSKEDREQIRKEIESHPWQCILIGSVQVVGRWFDCPPLDLWLLTTAEKFTSNIEQYIGRVIRQSSSKTKVEFIDMVDIKQPILFSQSKSRLNTFKKSFP